MHRLGKNIEWAFFLKDITFLVVLFEWKELDAALSPYQSGSE